MCKLISPFLAHFEGHPGVQPPQSVLQLAIAEAARQIVKMRFLNTLTSVSLFRESSIKRMIVSEVVKAILQRRN